jgi:hypothetical protein
MRAAAAAAVLLAALLAGCPLTSTSGSGLGYSAEPTLEALGLRERCVGQDSSCSDRALEVIRQLLDGLGPRVNDPVAQQAAEGQPDGVFVITASSDPPFEFRTADGSAGTTLDVSVDVTPSLEGRGAAYVVMEAGAFEIDPEGARALLDALFVRLD